MKKKCFILIFKFFIFLQMFVLAQSGTKYYLSYSDFVREMDVSPSQVIGKPFYRAKYDQDRVRQLDHILANGDLSTRTQFYYDGYRNLVLSENYTADSILITRTSFVPDEIQKQMLPKIQGRNWISLQKNYFTVTYYDSTQKPVKYEVKAASGEDVGRLELRYNKQGALIYEVWIRTRDNKVMEVSEFEFDPEKSIQHIVQYDSSGFEISNVSIELPANSADSTR